MSDSSTAPATEDLQFDRVESSAAPGGLVCSRCSSPIRMYYYHVNGETTCSTCKAAVDRSGGGAGSGRAGSGMARAALFGAGAAIAGAAIYYAVMEYLDLEIGIVAILIGYMVGHSVRKASTGHGGRRFQVLAAGLTYLAVALAYAPFAVRSITDPDSGVTADSSASTPLTASTDSIAAVATDATDSAAATSSDDASTALSSTDSVVLDSTGATAPVIEESAIGAGGIALGLAGILFFVLALPIIVILGSMPGGLISAAIIAFGMHQAWTMTGSQPMTVTGPFKVGAEPPPATA